MVRNLLGGRGAEMKVGFEVFTAVVMKSIIFWDMTLCSPWDGKFQQSKTHRYF
jgi:hypothetical protein